MAETIKSALLFDYESLHRSLGGGPIDTRLADRAAAWLAAIETGRLIGPPGTHRRLVVLRCYAGPSVLGKHRDTLAAVGFDVVDCGANDGNGRSSADIHIAIDTIDGLSRPDGPDEFILMTTSADLGPLLSRLKGSKRLAVVYADAATPEKDRSLADAVLDRAAFAAFLSSDETPSTEDRASKATADRADIEAFARKVHAATNIPLFSPKTYAELFKHLTDEIRENAYHFQTTARNVAERMTEAGRNVTRRQVVFIVKGLALKGHVFSTGDTPDKLAEVFREQARYLITNAGMTLDPRQEQLLNAWFASRAPILPPAPERPKPRPTPSAPNGAKPPVPPQAQTKPAPPPALAERPRTPEPARPLPKAPSVKPPSSFVRPVDLPKTSAKPAPPLKAAPSPAAREEAKAVIAARIAASAKLKPATRPAPPPKSAGKSGGASTQRPASPRKNSGDQTADELETSILAAIAEAVDVLVDDNAKQDAGAEEPPLARRKPAAQKPAEQEAGTNDGGGDDGDDGDIGDQIQRIIASYNRNRTDGEQS